jgi:hypothetical protein
LLYGDIPSEEVANYRSDIGKEVQLSQRKTDMWKEKLPETRKMLRKLLERRYGN